MGIVVAFMLGLGYTYSSVTSWKLKLSETIASGVAAFFLSPIFSVLDVYGFYNSLPESYKTGSEYARYQDFRLSFWFVFLFIYLLIIFIWNVKTTMALKKESK